MNAVAWAPHAPSHWSGASLKWLAQIYAGGTPRRDNLEYWTNGTIPWLNSGAVNDWVITEPSDLITEEALANSNARWVPANSVVIGLAGQGKTKGTSARLETRSTTNQSMAAIVPGGRLDYRFLHYWLVANYRTIRNLAGGDLRDGLNLQHIGSIPVPLPPRDEQQAIADYLDRETAQIDELIGEQLRLIHILQERRAALISHSVHGPQGDRDPSDGWRMIPFVRCMTSQIDYRGATPQKTDSGVQLITARNIRNGWIDYESSREFVAVEEYEQVMRRGLPHVGDLLFTMEAPLGNVAVVDRDDIALAQRIVRFEVDQDVAVPHFLCYAAQGAWFQSQLIQRATGSTALGIKASKLPELKIMLPGTKEQQRIVEFLRSQTTKIDDLVIQAQRLIELSQERRSALVTAAVTGELALPDGQRTAPGHGTMVDDA